MRVINTAPFKIDRWQVNITFSGRWHPPEKHGGNIEDEILGVMFSKKKKKNDISDIVH